MIATIIGSLSCSSEILKAAEFFRKELQFDVVHDPIANNVGDHTLTTVQRRYIDYISEADVIVLVRKPDGSIGESTSYELALCDFFQKPVVTWLGFGNYVYLDTVKTVNGRCSVTS